MSRQMIYMLLSMRGEAGDWKKDILEKKDNVFHSLLGNLCKKLPEDYFKGNAEERIYAFWFCHDLSRF